MPREELVEEVAKEVDAAIAELLLAFEQSPTTPQLRRALKRLCYVQIS